MTGMEPRPNVLFVVMDTARAKTVQHMVDELDAMGELIQDGAYFDNVFSNSPWTLPSHASMFTGQRTSDHNVHAGSNEFDVNVPSLATILKKAGYQTAGFSANAWITPEFGFSRGFQHYQTTMKLFDENVDLIQLLKKNDSFGEKVLSVLQESAHRRGYRTLLNAAYIKLLRKRYDSGALLLNYRIKKWINGAWNRDRPFFAFVNYLEPHLEYDPPGRYKRQFLPDREARRKARKVNQKPWQYIAGKTDMSDEDFELLRSLYKAEVAYLDYRIGNLLKYLQSLSILDETMVILVGDHGENIGEHGMMDHQYSLYDTLINVPLIVRYPEEIPSGERFSGLLEARDLYPSILDITGVAHPSDRTQSKTTIADVINGGGRDHVISEYVTPQPSMEALHQEVGDLPESVLKYDRSLRAIRTAEWKLIEGSDGHLEVFNVANDGHEANNVAGDNPDLEAKFSERLAAETDTFAKRGDDESTSVDDDVAEQLEELGYL